jgi:hypothetical protein
VGDQKEREAGCGAADLDGCKAGLGRWGVRVGRAQQQRDEDEKRDQRRGRRDHAA